MYTFIDWWFHKFRIILSWQRILLTKWVFKTVAINIRTVRAFTTRSLSTKSKCTRTRRCSANFYLSSYGPVRKPSAHITKIEPRKSNHGTRDKDDGDKQPLFVYSNISHQITAYSPTCKTLRHNMFANMHLVSCFLHFSINHLIKPTIIDLIVSWEGSWYFSCWEFPRSSWEFLKIFGVENLPPGNSRSKTEPQRAAAFDWAWGRWHGAHNLDLRSTSSGRLAGGCFGVQRSPKPCPWNKGGKFSGF